MSSDRLHPLPARWPRLMSVEIAAEYLSISKATLTMLQVECVRIGKRRLYDRSVLDRYVDALSGSDSDRRGYDERLPLEPMDEYTKWKLQDGVR